MLQNPFNGFKTFNFTHSQPISEKGKREERMATGAVEMMLRCVFDGCLSMQDMETERRPYHKNCSCQLHKSKGVSSNACPHQRNVSFSMKHSRTSCSLSIAASNSSSQCSFLGDLSNRNREDANGALSQTRQIFSEALIRQEDYN